MTKNQALEILAALVMAVRNGAYLNEQDADDLDRVRLWLQDR